MALGGGLRRGHPLSSSPDLWSRHLWPGTGVALGTEVGRDRFGSRSAQNSSSSSASSERYMKESDWVSPGQLLMSSHYFLRMRALARASPMRVLRQSPEKHGCHRGPRPYCVQHFVHQPDKLFSSLARCPSSGSPMDGRCHLQALSGLAGTVGRWLG